MALVAVLLLAVACAPVADRSPLAEQTGPSIPAPTEPAPGPAPSPTDAPDSDTATVVQIIDGDTFDARLADGRTERIRPPQFDAPERDECWHDEATALLEDLIGGREVRLIGLADGPDRDPNGRLLRAVEIDGRDVGALMLEAGAARWLDRYAHEDPRLAAMYEAAEQEARENGRGLWSACPGSR